MTKEELIKELEDLIPENADEHARASLNDRIERIRYKLQLFPDNTPVDTLWTVSTYLGRIRANLSAKEAGQLFDKLDSELSNCVDGKVHKARNALARTRRIFLYVFLGTISLLGVLSIVCMVLGFVMPDMEILGPIGNACGFLDFSLGALGFVIERLSDMKNKSTMENLQSKSVRIKDPAVTNGELKYLVNEFKKEYGIVVKNNKIKLDPYAQLIIGNGNTVN